MKRLIMFVALVMVIGLIANSTCFSANTASFNVSAIVPPLVNGLQRTISKIDASNDKWLQPPAEGFTSVDFETLTWDTTYKIFRASYYYAVDVGVFYNGQNNWTIMHTRSDLAKGTDNINENVNVAFVRQTPNNAAGDLLQKVSYQNSNSVVYSRSQLSGGWLRIYYGIATGNKDAAKGFTDADGVKPVDVNTPIGTYSGTITLTLTGV